MYNSGNMKRDFTFVGDIIKGTVAALANPASLVMVINLGNSKPQSVLTLVKLIRKLLRRVTRLDSK